MAPYSEIYTPAEEDKTNNVIDSGDSSDEDTQIKTVEGRAKGKGNDYQEDDVNGERLC